MEGCCRKCGLIGSSIFCPNCGEPMRDIIIKTEDDIFVKKLTSDSISSYGYHVRCNDGRSVVDQGLTSSGKPVFVCHACSCRIIDHWKGIILNTATEPSSATELPWWE